jgi:hypothetical protein
MRKDESMVETGAIRVSQVRKYETQQRRQRRHTKQSSQPYLFLPLFLPFLLCSLSESFFMFFFFPLKPSWRPSRLDFLFFPSSSFLHPVLLAVSLSEKTASKDESPTFSQECVKSTRLSYASGAAGEP